MINRLIPEIIPATITPIDKTITEDAAGSGETLQARQTILLKKIVTDAAHNAARVLQTPADVNRHGKNGTTPRDGNTAVGYYRLTPQLEFVAVPLATQAGMGSNILSIQGGP